MTKYSPEPTRRKLRLQFSFNDFNELGDPIDLSPYANNGNLQGDYELVVGKLGQALRFNGEDTFIQVPDSSRLDVEEYTISFWARPDPFRNTIQRIIAKRTAGDASTFDISIETDGQISVYISDSGDTNNISLSSGETLTDDEWTFVTVTFDDTSKTAKIRFDREVVASGQNTSLGDISNNSDVYIGRNYSTSTHFYHGDLDDVRVLFGVSDDDEIDDLWSIAAEHQSADDVADAWDNPGIPFLRGAPNERLASTLAEHQSANLRDLDAVRDSTHIDSAAGQELDRKGRGHGILRETDETDAHYRARIKATLSAGRSRGTFEDILQAASVVVETDKDRIEIREDFDPHPATAFVYIRSADLDDAELTAAEVEDILRDTVPGGHQINVISTGASPFTVLADGDANNSDLGLTSDSISTGGTLVSDV